MAEESSETVEAVDFSTALGNTLDRGFQNLWLKMHELHEQQREYLDKSLKELVESNTTKVLVMFTSHFEQMTKEYETDLKHTDAVLEAFIRSMKKLEQLIWKRFSILEQRQEHIYHLLSLPPSNNANTLEHDDSESHDEVQDLLLDPVVADLAEEVVGVPVADPIPDLPAKLDSIDPA